ncbi:MAG: 50S ribosomal protein L31 [Firmicutes bacterium]|jgi:large subunit ribosomal protein L31|nr:50S ribosomal protein L31 [Bacillota bacterium]
MQANIHPNYGKSTVTCACGETFETGSTKKEIRVEVCSKCHPFYTGQRQAMTNKGGRIERFRARYNIKD